MSDIAEMMLEGILCATCGVYLDSEPVGFPKYCEQCAIEKEAEE
jgi:hypothetical protein